MSAFKRVAVTSAALGVAAVTVYTVPVFKETRTGCYLAYHYPYDVLQKGTYNETAWRLGLGTLGGLGSAFALARGVGGAAGSSNPVLGIPKTALAMFTGMVTFSLTLQFTDYIVPPAHRATKFVMYALDGLVADVAGRSDGDLPIWEKRDGITRNDIERYVEHESARKKVVGETSNTTSGSLPVEDPIERLSKLDASGLEKELEKDTLSGNVRKRALEMHRQQLVSGLLKMRREQELLDQQIASKQRGMKQLGSGPQYDDMKESLENLHNQVKDLDNRKASLKETAARVHNASLNTLCEAEVFVKVHKLEELRERQLTMAQQARDSGSFDRMVLRKQLRAIDAEKYDLKKSAKDAFGVRISKKAASVEPWRHVLEL